jgi:hypothetical protein
MALASNLASDATGSTEESDTREAVFRYQFEQNSSGQQKRAAVYCPVVSERIPTRRTSSLSDSNHKPPKIAVVPTTRSIKRSNAAPNAGSAALALAVEAAPTQIGIGSCADNIRGTGESRSSFVYGMLFGPGGGSIAKPVRFLVIAEKALLQLCVFRLGLLQDGNVRQQHGTMK